MKTTKNSKSVKGSKASTKKAKTTTAKTSKKKKTRSKEEKSVDKATKAAATQKVTINRDLKYVYPKGCISQVDRKAFRQAVRNKIRKMERDLNQEGISKKEAKSITAELKAYRDTVMA